MNILVNELEFIEQENNLWEHLRSKATLKQLSMSSWATSITLTTNIGTEKEYTQVGETPDIAINLLRILLENDYSSLDQQSKAKAAIFDKRGKFSFCVIIDVDEPDLTLATFNLLKGLSNIDESLGVRLQNLPSVNEVSVGAVDSRIFEEAYVVAETLLSEEFDEEDREEQEQEEQNKLLQLTTTQSTNKYSIN